MNSSLLIKLGIQSELVQKISWINGRELKSYEDDNQIIEYKYNKDSIEPKRLLMVKQWNAIYKEIK